MPHSAQRVSSTPSPSSSCFDVNSPSGARFPAAAAVSADMKENDDNNNNSKNNMNINNHGYSPRPHRQFNTGDMPNAIIAKFQIERSSVSRASTSGRRSQPQSRSRAGGPSFSYSPYSPPRNRFASSASNENVFFTGSSIGTNLAVEDPLGRISMLTHDDSVTEGTRI